MGAQMKELETVILDTLERKQPSNVNELVQLVQKQVDATLEDIENEINKLHQKGLISLEDPTYPREKFITFISPRVSRWFWIIVSVSILAFVTIMFIPEIGNTLSYLRYIFAFLLVAFLSGYCLTEALFPKETALDIIERIAFSIGLSFAITALVGLFLSFTPIGLTLATSLPTLDSLVLILAVVALIRKYWIQ